MKFEVTPVSFYSKFLDSLLLIPPEFLIYSLNIDALFLN